MLFDIRNPISIFSSPDPGLVGTACCNWAEEPMVRIEWEHCAKDEWMNGTPGGTPHMPYENGAPVKLAEFWICFSSWDSKQKLLMA